MIGFIGNIMTIIAIWLISNYLLIKVLIVNMPLGVEFVFVVIVVNMLIFGLIFGGIYGN